MKFARVEGFVSPLVDRKDLLQLLVMIDDGKLVSLVREEQVGMLETAEIGTDLAWQADQYTQETIGTLLSEQGWELLGVSETPPGDALTPFRSQTYLVRQL